MRSEFENQNWRVDPPELRKAALDVLRKLNGEGYQAFLAGGAVRDLLLGNRISDIDIATSARPEKIEALFEKTISVGRQFGVVVVQRGAFRFEVTTFRREGGYLDGRHPGQISFTDSREDALRRDFTVNALFLDPFSGTLHDFVEGQADLQRKLIRTVGEPSQRFEEDKLRIIRAIRFACQLGFEIEETTWKELIRFAPSLRQVSWERIRDELLKILTGPDPSRGLHLLLDADILKVILPEVADMVGVQQPPQFHPEGDVFVHTCLMFSLAEDLDDVLALAVLLHDVGKPLTFTVRERIRFDGHAEVGAEMAAVICRRLRLSGQQTEDVVDLVRDHLRFIHVQEMRDSTLKRFLRKPNFTQHLRLHRLDCLASHGDLSSYHFCVQKLQELREEEMRPAPLLSGHDLIDAGLTPGPVFSEILGRLEDLQLEMEIVSRDDALRWVRENYCRKE